MDRILLSVTFANLPSSFHQLQSTLATIPNGPSSIIESLQKDKEDSEISTNKSNFGYFISLAYRDVLANSSWITVVDKCDLPSLVRKEADLPSNVLSSSASASLETAQQGELGDEIVSLDVHLTTRHLLLTIEYSPFQKQEQLVYETPLKFQNQMIHTLAMSIHGVKSNDTQDSMVKRERRVTLFAATDFHLQLLQVCQEESTRVDLRNASLDLLYSVLCASNSQKAMQKSKGTNDISYIVDAFNYENFVKFNVVLAPNTTSTTATLATKLLLHTSHLSAFFKVLHSTLFYY